MASNELNRPAHGDTRLQRHHIRIGWLLLALFGTLGLVLESLHGLKLQWYVGVVSSTRREMWTLAHAHGTLLAIVHLGFAATLSMLSWQDGKTRRAASRLLLAASVCMPLGFFLGGLVFYEGDPGLGILLVPVGAVCLIASAMLAAYSTGGPQRVEAEPKQDKPKRKKRR